MPSVSIGIPTYRRPDLLKIALDSCLAQTFEDFEIVIVDDSPDIETEQLISNISAKQPIICIHNKDKQGQAAAKNQLLDKATGKFFVLLHDDNMLLPNALEDLIRPLEGYPDVVVSFGKQHSLTNDGFIEEAESVKLNERYYRTDDRGDQVQSSEWAALVQQLPGDSYMVRTSAAQATRYRSDIGECCDAEFGWRLCRRGAFFFVGKYTAADRRNQAGLTASGLRIHLSNLYPVLESLPVSEELESVRSARLQQLAPVAVTGCLLRGARFEALRILLGKSYPWRQQSAKGILKLGLAVFPRNVIRTVLHHHA